MNMKPMKKKFYEKIVTKKNTDLCKPLLMASMALPVLKQKRKKEQHKKINHMIESRAEKERKGEHNISFRLRCASLFFEF